MVGLLQGLVARFQSRLAGGVHPVYQPGLAQLRQHLALAGSQAVSPAPGNLEEECPPVRMHGDGSASFPARGPPAMEVHRPGGGPTQEWEGQAGSSGRERRNTEDTENQGGHRERPEWDGLNPAVLCVFCGPLCPQRSCCSEARAGKTEHRGRRRSRRTQRKTVKRKAGAHSGLSLLFPYLLQFSVSSAGSLCPLCSCCSEARAGKAERRGRRRSRRTQRKTEKRRAGAHSGLSLLFPYSSAVLCAFCGSSVSSLCSCCSEASDRPQPFLRANSSMKATRVSTSWTLTAL